MHIPRWVHVPSLDVLHGHGLHFNAPHNFTEEFSKTACTNDHPTGNVNTTFVWDFVLILDQNCQVNKYCDISINKWVNKLGDIFLPINIFLKVCSSTS